MNSVPLGAEYMAAFLFFVTGGRWELNPQETCSTDMPDIPIVGTATVGAPGATRKPTLLITNQPLFHLSYRCNLVERQRDFNPHPSRYRGDALTLSYAG
jgi:hypothetical protein